MSYSDVIKDIFIENNLSQQKFAEIIGVNQTTVSQWLLGHKKPGFDSIMAIYDHFEITPNTIFSIDK